MKDTSALVSALGYHDSPHYLSAESLRATAPSSLASWRFLQSVRLHGTYVLRPSLASPPEACLPVLHVLEAESEEEAERVHRAVWNQNRVPFLLIRTPLSVRLCAGFRFDTSPQGPELRGLLEDVRDWNEVPSRLLNLHAERLEDGSLWRHHGRHVTADTRVDRRLLASLGPLHRRLLADGLSRDVAHALLGRFLFLRYLRDGRFLSPARLEAWRIRPDEAFGRGARLESVRRLFEAVEDWLGGSLFPMPLSGPRAPTEIHIQQVTAALLGEAPRGGQARWDFELYDFSLIPIETLSTLYQKLLHAQEGRGRELGAYYTPPALVHFTLSEMEALRPLRREDRVLDPSCGAGAFLVPCYRRLVERRIREAGGRRPPLEELKAILAHQVHGVDTDEGACRMAELGLVLTLLDAVDPEDLDARPDFKLPTLYGANIVCSDFFAPGWEQAEGRQVPGFDWVVGNPPWFQINGEKASPAHGPAWEWVRRHQASCPISGNQMAEAFAWKASRHLAPGGLAGLVLPAMTLFKEKPDFRQRFFQAHHVHSIANLANLGPYLFLDAMAGAAVFFFSPGGQQETEIPVFSPMLANQQVLVSSGSRDAWALAVDASEIQAVPAARARRGDALPWKWAMWGTARDEQLLERVRQRHPILGAFLASQGLRLAEGPQLKSTPVKGGSDRTRFIEEFVGLHTFDTRALAGLHVIPPSALEPITRQQAHARERGGLKVLEARLFKPPQVLVAGTGGFAIFSEGPGLVVPSRHLVIGGEGADAGVLKALALYLNSDFAHYHRCFTSPQWGVRGGRSTLATLESLPTPLGGLSRQERADWEKLHAELVAGSEPVAALTPHERRRRLREDRQLARYLERLNRMCGERLGLSVEEQEQVEDFVQVRSHLAEGLAPEAVRPPTQEELQSYAHVLQSHLDAGLGRTHRVQVAREEAVGLVGLVWGETTAPLWQTREHLAPAQWIYFRRNLRLFRDDMILVVKPLQRFGWTRSQAARDAEALLAELPRTRAGESPPTPSSGAPPGRPPGGGCHPRGG